MQHAVAVVAHRGDSGNYPENTLLAFRKAIEIGVEMIEFDVHLTADDALMLIHDPTVDRTTDGAGRVRDLSLAEIKRLDTGVGEHAQFAGERIPTLQEALAEIPASVRLNVHLKADDDARETRARETRATKAIQAIRDAGRGQSAFIASDTDTVKRVREIAPKLETCSLTRPSGVDYVEESLQLGCRILQPGHNGVSPDLVTAAHRHGMEVNVFYADDEAEMKRLIEMGVDGILTNYPARLREICH